MLNDSYCGIGTTISENTQLKKIHIGRFCSIGQNVRNALGMHPSKIFVSTYPGFYSPSKDRLSFTIQNYFNKFTYIDDNQKWLNEIGNDVWIGNNVVLMDGITIGNGAIIGTGAVVTKDIEPYAIVGGVPAKFIRYRFSKEEINFLLKFKWWEKDIEWLKRNSYLFQDIEKFIYEFKNIDKQ